MRITSARARSAHFITYLPIVVAALFGLGLAWLRFGPEVLDPTNISWFKGDSVTHFLAWNFFRYESWHLQPGRVTNMMAPLGANIGSGDALPLLAFPFKLLSPLLPTNFQYLGLWLFVNYALQAVFGYLLAAVFLRRWQALLAGLFFLVSPIMIFRAGHIALSSQWLILMALWHYFSVSRAATFDLRHYRVTWAVNVGLTGLVHPYLAAMVFPIAVASLLRETFHSKRLKPLQALLILLLLTTLPIAEWWITGLIGTGQNPRGWGFNYFNMNLISPFNPEGKSRILPTLPSRDGQYEGFAFLGTGVLVLSVLALARSWRRLGSIFLGAVRALYRRGHLALLVFSLLFVGYAVGDGLTVGEFLIPNYSIFKNFPALISTFRAPGRFFWPAYYLIYLALFVFLVKVFSPRQATLLLLVGLSLQVADLKLNRPYTSNQTNFRRHLKSERWPELMETFSRVATTPAFERDTAKRGDFVDFSFLASRSGTELTTGAIARTHVEQTRTKFELLRQALLGPRQTDALYVFSTLTFAEKFYKDLEPGLECYPLDGYLVCHDTKYELGLGRPVDTATFVPKGYERVTLKDFVDRYRDQTVILTTRGGPGRYSLDLKVYLSKRGSKIGTIGVLQGSYVALLHRGELIFEDISDDTAVTHDWAEGTVIGQGENALKLPEKLYVYSSGTPTHRVASVATYDESHNASTQGFSVLVLDEAFNIVEAVDFNTVGRDTVVLKRKNDRLAVRSAENR